MVQFRSSGADVIQGTTVAYVTASKSMATIGLCLFDMKAHFCWRDEIGEDFSSKS